MTNEQFSREYHLLDRLSQGPVVTHHAQSATGAMVMVHFLRGNADENAAIVRMLDALTPERRARILARVDVDGVAAVVTKFILDFTSFQEWLSTGAAHVASRQENAPASPPAATTIPTPLTPEVPTAAPPAEPPPVSNSPAAASIDAPVPIAPPPSRPAGPGEFTRMFQSAGPSAAAHRAESPADPTPPAPVAPRPGAPASAPPAGAPPSAGGPGEFTLLFRGTPPVSSAPVTQPRPDPLPPASPPVAPAASAAPAAPNQASAPLPPVPPIRSAPSNPSAAPQPGEFTRMFGAPMPLAAPPTASSPPAPSPQNPRTAPAANQPSSFFAEPAHPVPDPYATAKPPSPQSNDLAFDQAWSGFSAPPQQPASPPAGPGEYTRLFGSPAAAPPPAPMQPPPAAAPPQSLDWGGAGGSIGSSTGDSYFDRLVGGAPSAPPASANFPPAAQPLPPASPAFAGPSEFTRIISAPPPSPALTPPAARPVAPPPPPVPIGGPRKAGDRVLLFSLVGVVVLAILIVTVFLIAT